MIRHLTVLTLAVSPLLAAGCAPEPNLAARPDAAYQQLDTELGKQGMKRLDFQEAPVKDVKTWRLDFQEAPVKDVKTWLESGLGFKVEETPAATAFIAQADPRVTARTGEIPANLAYNVLRALLEAKGLTLEPVDNAFGKPKLTLDRSVLREASPAATR